MSGKNYLLILGCLLCIWSCDRERNGPEFPTYLRLNTPSVIIDDSGFESDIAVKDFWVDQSGTTLGVHPLPNIIPVLIPSEGSIMTFAPGIFENGLSSIRTPYPFMRGIAQVVEPAPLDTIDIDLTIEYLSTDSVLEFALNEDFSRSTSSFESDNQRANSTTMFNSTEAAFQGIGGGKVTFSSTRYEFYATTRNRIVLPQRGANDVWMEITYKSDIAFTVGLNYFFILNPELGQIPSGVFFQSPDEWKTVYIHFNDAIRSLGEAAVFEPYIQASGLDETGTRGKDGFIFLDNIRIVHFRP